MANVTAESTAAEKAIFLELLIAPLIWPARHSLYQTCNRRSRKSFAFMRIGGG